MDVYHICLLLSFLCITPFTSASNFTAPKYGLWTEEDTNGNDSYKHSWGSGCGKSPSRVIGLSQYWSDKWASSGSKAPATCYGSWILDRCIKNDNGTLRPEHCGQFYSSGRCKDCGFNTRISPGDQSSGPVQEVWLSCFCKNDKHEFVNSSLQIYGFASWEFQMEYLACPGDLSFDPRLDCYGAMNNGLRKGAAAPDGWVSTTTSLGEVSSSAGKTATGCTNTTTTVTMTASKSGVKGNNGTIACATVIATVTANSSYSTNNLELVKRLGGGHGGGHGGRGGGTGVGAHGGGGGRKGNKTSDGLSEKGFCGSVGGPWTLLILAAAAELMRLAW